MTVKGLMGFGVTHAIHQTCKGQTICLHKYLSSVYCKLIDLLYELSRISPNVLYPYHFVRDITFGCFFAAATGETTELLITTHSCVVIHILTGKNGTTHLVIKTTHFHWSVD